MSPRQKKLPPDELSRYVRQMALPDINLQGQEKLKQAKILVVGAGGLASPVLLYLTASGIGHIGIVDGDSVDISNLHRQVLFTEVQQQQLKTESAKQELKKRNHFVDIKTFSVNLSADNALAIIQGYDIVVDCTDNFATRYLVNDACYELGIANIHASISQFEGQCSIFCANYEVPCYRCLYAEPPPKGLIPNCAEGGVLGVLPGLLGMIQATEVIKFLLNIGETLTGRLLTVDVLSMKFETFPIKQNSHCELCSGQKTFTTVNRNFYTSCDSELAINAADTISAHDLQKKLDVDASSIFILDVREPYEYKISNMKGYLIPLKELDQRVNELDTSKEIVVHCESGTRSAKAVSLLQEQGIVAVSLFGGINAWRKQIATIVGENERVRGQGNRK